MADFIVSHKFMKKDINTKKNSITPLRKTLTRLKMFS